jgi:single-strand DNA-binding protein
MLNTVNLVGAVVRHELRTTAKLTPVLEVTLAGVDAVGERRFAWYHQVNYLGKRAEHVASLLAPGAGVIASGRLDYRSWEAPDGGKRFRVSVQAESLEVFAPQGDHLDYDQGGNPRLAAGAVNRVILAGNLTRDPEQGERGPAKAGLAVSEWVPGRNGEKGQEKAHFFDLVAWNGLGEILRGLTKGEPVFVEGRLVAESWEAQDGTKRYATRVEVARLLPLIRPGKAAAEPQSELVAATSRALVPDLPPI